MTQIERRQTRLRRIRAKNMKDGSSTSEVLAIALEAHHVIGASQNLPENILQFVKKGSSDPALKVVIPTELCFTKLNRKNIRISSPYSKSICSPGQSLKLATTAPLSKINSFSKATACIGTISQSSTILPMTSEDLRMSSTLEQIIAT